MEPTHKPVDHLPVSAAPASASDRLAALGMALGFVPFMLIVPLLIYRMEFMLWTWVWPTMLSLVGAALSGYTLARIPLSGRRRAQAVAGFVAGLAGLIVSLAGFGAMVWAQLNGAGM